MTRKRRSTPLVPPEPIRNRWASTLAAKPAAAVELLFTLRETAHQLDKIVSSWLGEDAISAGRWQLLMTLWSIGTPLSQADIARTLGLSRPTVSEHLEGLRLEGHVAISKDKTDSRKQVVALTELGTVFVGKLVQENAMQLTDVFRNHDKATLGAIADALKDLRASFPSPD